MHAPILPVFAGDDAGQDRQLLRAKAQGFAGDDIVHAVDLEHDPAGMDRAAQ